MAAQSFAMGQAFGTSFQYGKRKISSMSNEEFNALNATKLHDDLQGDVRAMIPSMNQSFDRMEKFQIEIIQSMLDTFVLALQEFGKFLAGGVSAVGDSIQQGLNTDVLTVETRSDIPSFIPQASASTGGSTQKFASDYEREALALPNKLLIQIVKTFGTRTDIPIEKRVGYINAFNKRNPAVKKLSTAELKAKTTAAITASATGDVAKIATMFNLIKARFVQLKKTLRMPTGPTKVSKLSLFRKLTLGAMKNYNRYVQSIGRANLTIDTAKSLSLNRIIPK